MGKLRALAVLVVGSWFLMGAACTPVLSTIPMDILAYVPIRDVVRDLVRDVRLMCFIEASKKNPTKLTAPCDTIEVKAIKLNAVDHAVLEAMAAQIDTALKQERLREAMREMAEVMKFAASVYSSGGASLLFP